MKRSNPAQSPRVSVGEIADLAGVRSSSAVSNWRTRHADFPSPVEHTRGGDLFDLNEIRRWLTDHGKAIEASSHPDKQLHELVGAKLRESGQLIDHSVLIILQLLYLRMITEPREDGYQPASHLWTKLTTSEDPIRVWKIEIEKLGNGNELARILTLPPGTDPWDVNTAHQFVSEIEKLDATPGELATSILRHYEEWQGIRGSAAISEEQLTALIIGLLEPITRSIYDPAAGVAMVLADAWRQRTSNEVSLFGQEVSEFNWKLGYLHLALYKANYELQTGDTLVEDRFRSRLADKIALDPSPGSHRSWSHQVNDERWRYGAPSKNSQWLWAQHVVFHLKEDGVGVMTIPPAGLTRGGADARTRMRLVESNWLDAVIDLPQGMASGSSVGVALLVFAKSRINRANQVLFINATQLGKRRRGKSHQLGEDEIEKIQTTIRAWRDRTFQPEPLFAEAATIEDIRRNRGDLSPQRYLRYGAIAGSDREAVTINLRKSISVVKVTAANAEDVVGRIGNALSAFVIQDGVDAHIVKLGDVLTRSPQAGVQHEPQGEGPRIPFISTKLVSGGNGHLSQVPTEITYNVPPSRIAERGDLLLVSRGLNEIRGGCSIIEFGGGAAYAQSLIKLSTDPLKLDPNYLRIFLTSNQGRAVLAAATTGSVIGNLRKEAIGQIEIPLPPLTVQRQMAAAMNRLEGEVSRLSSMITVSDAAVVALQDAVVAGIVRPSSSGTR